MALTACAIFLPTEAPLRNSLLIFEAASLLLLLILDLELFTGREVVRLSNEEGGGLFASWVRVAKSVNSVALEDLLV